MAKSIEAEVEPKLLVWTRKTSGLELERAARLLKIEPERLAAWERGEERPTLAQLRKLAGLYKRPLAVFFLAEPPRGFTAMRSFRRLPGREPREESLALGIQIRETEARRSIALDLAKEMGDSPSLFDLRVARAGNLVASAARIREALHAPSPGSLTYWKSEAEAFRGWRKALEGLGILVFQASGVSVDEMRGYSIFEEAFPVIVVNTKDNDRPRIFTLIHELAHLLQAQSNICDEEAIAAGGKGPASDPIEVFCNALAGEILVPSSELAQMGTGRLSSEQLPWQIIKTLSNRFWVSQEVVLRRLLDTGRITRALYQARRDDLRGATRPPRKSGPVPYDRRVVASLGAPFIRSVLAALYSDRITLSDVSDYLGMKVRHLPKVEQAVFGREPRAV